MKKQFFPLVLMLVITIFSATVFAASAQTYEVPELDLTVDIPSDYAVFTRNLNANDPNLQTYGFTKSSLLSLMEERNIYLNACKSTLDHEIVITMTDALFEDYHNLGDTTLLILTSILTNKFSDYGVSCDSVNVYPHDQAKFVELYLSQSETQQSLQYTTMYGGKMINITLHSIAGPITSNQKTLMRSIVDSVHFGTDYIPREVPSPTEPFVYTDSSTGLTFTVPANWTEQPMSKERQFIDAKFVSNLDEVLCIIFGTEDFFTSNAFREEFSAIERVVTSRSMLNNSVFEQLSKEEIQEIFSEISNGDVKSWSLETFGEKEYYVLDVDASTEIYGLSVTIPSVWLVRFDNGHLFVFQFFGNRDNPYFADFEALIASIEYPIFTDESPYVFAAWPLLLVLLIAGIIIVIFIKRRKSKKSKTFHQPLLCHNCNAELNKGCKFCHKCGTSVLPSTQE